MSTLHTRIIVLSPRTCSEVISSRLDGRLQHRLCSASTAVSNSQKDWSDAGVPTHFMTVDSSHVVWGTLSSASCFPDSEPEAVVEASVILDSTAIAAWTLLELFGLLTRCCSCSAWRCECGCRGFGWFVWKLSTRPIPLRSLSRRQATDADLDSTVAWDNFVSWRTRLKQPSNSSVETTVYSQQITENGIKKLVNFTTLERYTASHGKLTTRVFHGGKGWLEAPEMFIYYKRRLVCKK